MTMTVDSPPAYPFVRCMARHGKVVALVVALIVSATSVVAALTFGSVLVLVAGLIVSLLLGVAIASASEVLQIIAETLIPR